MKCDDPWFRPVDLNEAVASQLKVQIGDTVLLRVRKPSALSQDAVITPRSGATVAMRLLNQLGQSMTTLPTPAHLDSGAFESEIGLGSLQPSDYLIEITASSADKSAKVLVPIRITG